MRLFVGIALPAEVIEALDALSRRLRTDGDGLRWSSPETWHITLQFLGETSAERFACAVERLGGIHAATVPVGLRGTGIFERAGVFWAGVTVSAELQELQRKVVAAMALCGVQGEDRPYSPHVTLARAKADGRAALRRLQKLVEQDREFPHFIAREFLLYESHLGRGGATHEVRQRFPLGQL